MIFNNQGEQNSFVRSMALVAAHFRTQGIIKGMDETVQFFQGTIAWLLSAAEKFAADEESFVTEMRDKYPEFFVPDWQTCFGEEVPPPTFEEFLAFLRSIQEHREWVEQFMQIALVLLTSNLSVQLGNNLVLVEVSPVAEAVSDVPGLSQHLPDDSAAMGQFSQRMQRPGSNRAGSAMWFVPSKKQRPN